MFYRLTSGFETYRCYPKNKLNYDPYYLFALRTRLYPYLKKKYGNGVYLTFESTKTYPTQYVQAVVNVREKKVETIDIRPYVEGDMINYCLVIDSSLPYEGIPTYWLKPILPYIGVDEKYNVGLNLSGMSLYRDGRLYVDLSKIIAYTLVYDNIVLDIDRLIRQMYRHGYIVGVDDDFAKRWNLERIANSELWVAKDSDKRWGPMSQVLINQWLGDEYLTVKIQPNLVKLCSVLQVLPDVDHDLGRIRFKANSLEKARKLTSLIEETNTNGAITIDKSGIKLTKDLHCRIIGTV